MDKFLADYRADKMTTIKNGLYVLCFASALFTFRGSSLLAEDFSALAGASVFALASGVAIYLFWYGALKVVPPRKTRLERASGLFVVLLGCALIIPLSSALNTAGLAGHDALETHLQRAVAQYEEIVAERYEQSRLIEGIVPDLALESARLRNAASDERENGSYTGRSGDGAVEESLDAIADRLDGLGETISAHLIRSEKSAGQAGRQLDVMRKIIVSDKPLTNRLRDVGKQADLLRTTLAQMNASGLVDSAGRVLDSLPREVEVRSQFSADPKTAQRQRAALGRVQQDIAQTTDVIGEFMVRISALAIDNIPAIERISPVRAVVKYAPDYISYWAGGIALDIAPFAVLVFLMMALSGKTEAELAQNDLMNMTVKTLIQSNLDQDAIRRMGLDPRSTQQINDTVLGRENHTPKEKPDDVDDDDTRSV